MSVTAEWTALRWKWLCSVNWIKVAFRLSLRLWWWLRWTWVNLQICSFLLKNSPQKLVEQKSSPSSHQVMQLRGLDMKCTGSFNPIQFQMTQEKCGDRSLTPELPACAWHWFEKRRGENVTGQRKSVGVGQGERDWESERETEIRELSDPSVELVTSLRQTALVS